MERKTGLTAEDVWAMFAETDKRIEKSYAKLREEIQELNRRTGGISNSNGLAAEEYFINSLKRNLVFAGIRFDSMRSNRDVEYTVRMPDGSFQTKDSELDIMMLNGNCAALIEVKYKARSTDVEELVTTKLEIFRKSFPQYKDFAVYLGLGSLSFDKFVEKKAKELGVGILKQVGETIEYETAWIRAY